MKMLIKLLPEELLEIPTGPNYHMNRTRICQIAPYGQLYQNFQGNNKTSSKLNLQIFLFFFAPLMLRRRGGTSLC